jgi:hypothetical protein
MDVFYLNQRDLDALTSAQYYSTYASHIGMWSLRDRLVEIADSINNGNHVPLKTKGEVFRLSPGDAEFETVKVGKSEYLVRKDHLNLVSIGICVGINTKVLDKLTNNDFAYVQDFWDKNDKNSIHHITEDGLYRGLRQ